MAHRGEPQHCLGRSRLSPSQLPMARNGRTSLVPENTFVAVAAGRTAVSGPGFGRSGRLGLEASVMTAAPAGTNGLRSDPAGLVHVASPITNTRRRQPSASSIGMNSCARPHQSTCPVGS